MPIVFCATGFSNPFATTETFPPGWKPEENPDPEPMPEPEPYPHQPGEDTPDTHIRTA